MKAVVIDVYEAEAYVALEDGRNMCIGLMNLPSNLKSGTTINISVASSKIANQKMLEAIF